MEKNKKKKLPPAYPVAMTVAGSDSGGGAGIQADLRTFNAFGVFGCSAITAVTSQNPSVCSRVDSLSAEAVTAQIDAVAGTLNVNWIKSGMLFSKEIVEAVAAAVEKYDLQLICDPVMISTSGCKLLQDDALQSVRDVLIPAAKWITPNIPEAELLLGHPVGEGDEFFASAGELAEKFGVSVLLKGGHQRNSGKRGDVPKMTDAVCCKGRIYELSSLCVNVPGNTAHGTGCTLSAALTACFALESPLKEALCVSKAFVLGSLVENVEIGKGVFAMYPPTEEYMSNVTIGEIS